MSVTPISENNAVTATSEAQFNAAVDNAKSELSDAELTEALITQAVTIGGQFIIMPRAQEILNEAQSDDDE
ncbi:hypothetical protein [Pseudomonas mucidolens]|uniref:Uncharacterized protein n=1 Tax=Pseudomonas mucidolens TaxID=46679 RepID=A0A1H2MVG1_9PSED|nr:hypothetical protein [Pseudomonas mucidolens]SDU97094.1 hypothetical protein SAMN05216202_2450 [Pseudomonas mucidolens]SQH33158.1 Uncharacterised protein [Pseudomonas mucidolens]